MSIEILHVDRRGLPTFVFPPSPRLIIVGASLLLCFLARLTAGKLIIDDAFITFRYAENLSTGVGFVYNPGEAVLGTSTPLFTLLIASSVRAGLSPESVSYAIGVLGDLLVILSLFYVSQKEGRFFAGAFSGLWFAVCGPLVLAAVSGMETEIYAGLVMSSFAAYDSGRRSGAWLLAAAVALLRPEGLLLLVAFFLSGLRRRELEWRGWIFAGIPVGAWGFFSSAYFGSPIPQSVVAKLAVYPQYPDLLHNTSEMLLGLGRPLIAVTEFAAAIPLMATGSGVPIPLFLLLPALLFVVILGIWSIRNTRLDSLAAWFILDFGFFAIPNRYLFPWYSLPLQSAFYFLFLAGVGSLVAHLSARIQLASRILLSVGGVGVALWLSVVLGMDVNTQRLELSRREEVYACIGNELRPYARDVTVASPEIGALGAAYGGKILDLAGVVSPVTLKYYLAPGYQFRFPHSVPPDLIREQRPEVVVMFDNLGSEAINDPWFVSNYRTAQMLTQVHPYYGSLGVYVRNDVSLTLGHVCATTPQRSVNRHGARLPKKMCQLELLHPERMRCRETGRSFV